MNADMKVRVSNLSKTEAEWSKIDFMPYPGELIVYTPAVDNKSGCVKIKIGDGVHKIHELPFVIEHTASELISEYKRQELFDAGCITDYFK